MSQNFTQIAYKGKNRGQNVCSLFIDFGAIFLAKMHIRGNNWVKNARFVSRFLAVFAYKGKSGGHLTILMKCVFSGIFPVTSTLVRDTCPSNYRINFYPKYNNNNFYNFYPIDN